MIGRREAAQVPEVAQVAQIPADARRLGLVASQLAEPQAVVGGEPVEAPPPAALPVLAIAPGDDRRLDDELFPFPRRAQRARRRSPRRRNRAPPARRRPARRREPRSVRGQASASSVGSAGDEDARQLRHLSEREVLVEALGRQPLGRAGDQRDERAPRGIGTARAAIEPGRHARAVEGVLEQPEIVLRRAQHDRHVVERHAARGFVEDAAGDLERLAPFARRGEEAHVAGLRAHRGRLGGEDVAAQAGQVRTFRRRVGGDVVGRAERRHQVADPRVVDRRRHERRRGPLAERRRESLLGGRVERHVEQDDRQADPADAERPRLGGRGKERGAVFDRRRGQLGLDALEQPREIRRARAVRGQRPRRDAGEPQLVHRAGQRARKAGQARDGREIREIAGRRRVEGHAGRDRLGARQRPGRLPIVGGARRGRARGQFGQAEAMQAEHRAVAPEIAREVVRGAARRRDDQPLSRRRTRVEKRPRPVEPRTRRGRDDGLDHDNLQLGVRN